MFKKMLLIMISISMINTIVTNASERQKVIEQINEQETKQLLQVNKAFVTIGYLTGFLIPQAQKTIVGSSLVSMGVFAFVYGNRLSIKNSRQSIEKSRDKINDSKEVSDRVRLLRRHLEESRYLASPCFSYE